MGGKGLRRRLADSVILQLIVWLGTVFVLSWALHQHGFGVGLIVGIVLLAANETLHRVLAGEWSPRLTRWQSRLLKLVSRGE